MAQKLLAEVLQQHFHDIYAKEESTQSYQERRSQCSKMDTLAVAFATHRKTLCALVANGDEYEEMLKTVKEDANQCMILTKEMAISTTKLAQERKKLGADHPRYDDYFFIASMLDALEDVYYYMVSSIYPDMSDLMRINPGHPTGSFIRRMLASCKEFYDLYEGTLKAVVGEMDLIGSISLPASVRTEIEKVVIGELEESFIPDIYGRLVHVF